MVARPVLALIVSLTAVGCATVRPVPDPEQFIAQSAPDVVFVTHMNGATLTITHPRVSGDSLLGDWAGAAQPIGLPLGQVRQITAAQHDRTRTVLLIAGMGVVAGSIVYLITRGASDEYQSCNWDQSYHDCDPTGILDL